MDLRNALLVLCQDERAKASQAPVSLRLGSDRAYPEACGAVLASQACPPC